MLKQKNCPCCNWLIDWDNVDIDPEGENRICPKCQTRLVGELKICRECSNENPIDAYYCLKCGSPFPVQ